MPPDAGGSGASGGESSASQKRNGFAEFGAADQVRISLWSKQYEIVKQAAEFFGLRQRRFTLLPDCPRSSLRAGQKRLHFIRHGEGHHNLWRAAEFAAGRTPHAKRSNFSDVPSELHDPELTETGREEAEAARADVKVNGCSPQLLVTSPVRRAVQTLLAAFEKAVAEDVPIVAHELCREAFRGKDPSIYDSRRPRSVLKKDFPRIDFDSFVLPEPEPSEGRSVLECDPLWWSCESPLGEIGKSGINETANVAHAYGFLCWLMSRPETEVAVASHSLFLLALYHGSLDLPDGAAHASPQVFHTGELRSIVIEEQFVLPTFNAPMASWGGALLAPDGLRLLKEEAPPRGESSGDGGGGGEGSSSKRARTAEERRA